MAAKTHDVNWYDEDVLLYVEGQTARAVEALAAHIDGLTKINIVQNDQVDTGFMVNSVYFATPDDSTYSDDSGTHINLAGNFVERQMAPEAPLPPEYDALVCVGANYAIFQEQQQPFLYPALLQAAAEADGIIEKAVKS